MMIGQACSDGNVILPQDDGNFNTYGKITLRSSCKDGSDPKLIVHVKKIQEVGTGGNIWILLTEHDTNKSISDLFSDFLEGKFLIGHSNNFINSYIITDICRFNDEQNNDIKLHYTQKRDHVDKNGDKVNHAWRSITWDLFDEFVPKND